MTNREIIFMESMRLMEAGVLHGSGVYAVITDAEGAERRVELPEAIHTFAAWKRAGYCVKRGEHAVACFPVWKYTERRRTQAEGAENAENGDEAPDADGSQAGGRMYMRKAFFFTAAQVEKITA